MHFLTLWWWWPLIYSTNCAGSHFLVMLNGVFLHTAFMFQYCGLSYCKSINKEENWVFKCGSYRVLDITVTFKCLSGFCAHQKKGNQDEKLRFGFMWCINLEVGSGRVQKKGSCVIILVWFWAWNVLCLSLGRTVRTVCQPQRKASLSVCYWNASCWHSVSLGNCTQLSRKESGFMWLKCEEN